MFLESFRHLIEIEALKKENIQNELRIASENKRISDLEERRKKIADSILLLQEEEKKLKLSELQKQIEELQARFKKLNSQLSLAATEKEQAAFEKQIQSTKEEIHKEESHYFEKLERSEEIGIQIQDSRQFMEGSLKTLEDIRNEVEKNIEQEKKIVSNRHKRIDTLLEFCLPDLRNNYQQSVKKFYPKSPVSYLVDKKCSACFIQADAILRASLEEGRSVEACPNCSRLLIPETAKIH